MVGKPAGKRPLERSRIELKLKELNTKLCDFSPQANYTDRTSDRCMSAKLMPTFADRRCCVVSATDLHDR
jgi:hypothetical protein